MEELEDYSKRGSRNKNKNKLLEKRVDKAKKYLTLVRDKFLNDEHKYEEFLMIMRAYKEQR
jgi:histone deacetylase complex regulatory component SIN3